MLAWNLCFPGKSALTSVTKIKISVTLSTKTLRTLSLAVEKVVGIPIIIVEKLNEKTELFMYMKRNLLDICYRGSNISSDLIAITEDVRKAAVDLPTPETVLHIDTDEPMLLQVFGCNARTLREVRKMKTEHLTILATYLAAKMEVPVPLKAPQMKSFCVLNYWRVNCLWDDVQEAMVIAQRAFISRLGEFKRTAKNLLRVVNEMFGNWSMKFKMYFLINGLLNFTDHYSNRHVDCARYFWWTQCGDTHLDVGILSLLSSEYLWHLLFSRDTPNLNFGNVCASQRLLSVNLTFTGN